MKVLVTGANGLLAANTIRELNSRGIEVRGMVRKTSNLLSLEGAEYVKVFGDMTSYTDVFKAAIGCDAIIHAAANTSQRPEDQKSDTDIRGVKNILKVVEEQKINRLIFVSTANSFGYGTLENPGTESDPVSPVFQKSAYAQKKIAAQNLVLEAAHSGKINAIVVNPTFIIGPNDAKPSSGRLMMMYLNGKLPVYPPGGKNFVATKDAAIAICNALTKGKSGECYLLAGENLSYKQFYEKVKVVSGVRKRMFPLPGKLLKLLGSTGSLFNRIGFSMELSRENAEILCINNFYSSRKAKNELAMPQSPIEEAIKESFEWFVSKNYFNINSNRTATPQN